MKKEAPTMFRYHASKALLVLVSCSSLAAGTLLVRCAYAAPGEVVDLDGDTHHNPAASTTDKSTPAPAAATDSAKPIENGAKEIKDAAKQEAAEKSLKRRAGERGGEGPRGSAQVLGMSLQEGTGRRVKVVDVSMNSPAFDAGVMKGDEILAYQGFRGESYRKWIDGIHRLTTDTGAGLKIPVVVARNGKQITVAIEVPAKPVRPSTTRALAQPGSTLIPPGVGTGTPMPTPGAASVVGGVGGNNVVLDNSGPIDDFFGGQAATANERAVAHLVRIGGQPSPNPSTVPGAAQSSAAVDAATPGKGQARIGMAGFRDEPSGMVVMVDVGALPPGNYTVAISDPSIVAGTAATGAGGANPNVPPSQGTPGQAPAPAGGGQVAPNGAEPVPAATPQPQSNLPPNSNRNIPRMVLAQVVATAEPASADLGSPSVAGTTPQSNNPPQAQAAPGVNGTAQTAPGAAPAGATPSQLGTITVDQSGIGRMRQKVESMQVRNVVGQAIVLYSQGGSQTTLPANLNGNAGAASRQGVTDSTSRGSQGATGANGGQETAASQTPAPGSQVPVAGGIIQLVNDRRPPGTAAPQTPQTSAGANGEIQQPASATPPAGQSLVR
jgi:PDZ domain